MMPDRRSRRRLPATWSAPISRTLVAAFALLLPLATAQGTSICSVATSIAAVRPHPPHLGCHQSKTGAASHGRDCCCKKTPQIRAAECNCHDGKSPAGPTVSDPILPECAAVSVALADAGPADPAGAAMHGRAPGAPDPRPPKRVSAPT